MAKTDKRTFKYTKSSTMSYSSLLWHIQCKAKQSSKLLSSVILVTQKLQKHHIFLCLDSKPIWNLFCTPPLWITCISYIVSHLCARKILLCLCICVKRGVVPWNMEALLAPLIQKPVVLGLCKLILEGSEGVCQLRNELRAYPKIEYNLCS